MVATGEHDVAGWVLSPEQASASRTALSKCVNVSIVDVAVTVTVGFDSGVVIVQVGWRIWRLTLTPAVSHGGGVQSAAESDMAPCLVQSRS